MGLECIHVYNYDFLFGLKLLIQFGGIQCGGMAFPKNPGNATQCKGVHAGLDEPVIDT